MIAKKRFLFGMLLVFVCVALMFLIGYQNKQARILHDDYIQKIDTIAVIEKTQLDELMVLNEDGSFQEALLSGLGNLYLNRVELEKVYDKVSSETRLRLFPRNMVLKNTLLEDLELKLDLVQTRIHHVESFKVSSAEQALELKELEAQQLADEKQQEVEKQTAEAQARLDDIDEALKDTLVLRTQLGTNAAYYVLWSYNDLYFTIIFFSDGTHSRAQVDRVPEAIVEEAYIRSLQYNRYD